MKMILACVGALIGFGMPAYADSPLPPPEKHSVTSTNGRFTVVSDLKSGTKCVDSQARKGLFGKKAIWSIDRWFRSMFVSNDGSHFVTEYGGLNLIPTNYTGDIIMITFWNNGNVVKEVSLDQLIPDKRILQKTVSHYHWGGIRGFNGKEQLEVELADDTIVLFDPTTGNRAKLAVGVKGSKP